MPKPREHFARLQTIDKELQQSRAALTNPEITRVWQELWQDSEMTQRRDLSSQTEDNYKKIFEDRIKFLKDRHGNDLEILKVSIQSKLSTCATKKSLTGVWKTLKVNLEF